MSRPRRTCGNILRFVSFLIHWRLGRLRSSQRISRRRSADTHWSSSESGEAAGVFDIGIDVTMLEESGLDEAAREGLNAGSPTCPGWPFAKVSSVTDWRVLSHCCVSPITVPLSEVERRGSWLARMRSRAAQVHTWNGIHATASVTDKGRFGMPACNLLLLDIVAACFGRLAKVSAR